MRFLPFFILIYIVNCYTSKDNVDKSYLIPLMKQSANGLNTIQVNIIGDSLSERSLGFGLQNKLGSGYVVNDFSVSGRTIYDWLFDISRPFSIIPNVVIIELGTNDVMANVNYDFNANLNKLLNEIKIRSSARIILTAVPLTDDKGLQNKIKANNNYVRSFSNSYTVVDLEKIFEDNRENIRLYPSYDPIHPNPFGYELIGEVYKKEILYLK
jgi:acyl-CoA thioesterase I